MDLHEAFEGEYGSEYQAHMEEQIRLASQYRREIEEFEVQPNSEVFHLDIFIYPDGELTCLIQEEI